MTPDVLILFTRHDKANAAFVEWIRATLDAAGMACELSEGASAGAADRARLLVVPLAGYGWRAITDGAAKAAVAVGVPVLAVVCDGTKVTTWPTMQACGALRDPLTLADLSPASAQKLVAAAWAKVQIAPLEVTVAIHAATGLELELHRTLAILADPPRMFDGRVVFRPLIWPAMRVQDPHGTVCLLWPDVHTALGSHDWPLEEREAFETPHALVLRTRRPRDVAGFDERLAAVARETAEVAEFLEWTHGPDGVTPSAAPASTSGRPSADFEERLRRYLVSCVRAAAERAWRSGALPDVPAPAHGTRRRREYGPVPPRFIQTGADYLAFRNGEADGPLAPPPNELSEAHVAAFAPEAVEPDRVCLLQIWACPPGSYAGMADMARSPDGESGRAHANQGRPVTAVFDVAIDLPGFEPAQAHGVLPWCGEPAAASFLMAAPPDAVPGPHAGMATMSIADVPFMRLHFDITVGRASDAPQDVSVREERISTIFASYASADRPSVLQWAQSAQAWDASIDVNVVTSREAVSWEDDVFTVVPAHDLFCLFWSSAARESPWVEREWRCALAARGRDYIHIVPLTDLSEVPLPAELAAPLPQPATADPMVLRYCDRCGGFVGPYRPGTVDPESMYVHGETQPADETCPCPRCGDHPSPFMLGTGRDCVMCRTLVPFHLEFCGYCGARLP